jgi:hypothetical protein
MLRNVNAKNGNRDLRTLRGLRKAATIATQQRRNADQDPSSFSCGGFVAQVYE